MRSYRNLLAAIGWLVVLICCAVVTTAADAPNDDLVKMVVGLLSEKDKDLRAVGLDQVRTEAKGEAATKQFAGQLPKLSPEGQVGLLSALADRKDAAARPAVLELLGTTRDDAVKVAAIAALGPLGETADTPLLVKSLAAASKAEQTAARASLVKLQGDAVAAAISQEQKQAPPPVRVALIEILATRRASDTIPDILAAAVDADAMVRAAAMIALGQLAGPEQIPGMVQGVLKAEKGKEREAAERAVATVCARYEDADRRAEPLLAVVDKLEKPERAAMLPTLGRVGGPAALKIIEAAIADPDPAQHEVGLRALANWPDAAIAPRFIEIVNSDPHPEHRAIALAAVIRVAPLADKRTPSERLELLQKALTLCTKDDERNQVVKRVRAIRTLESLRFLVPYLEQPPFAQQACESVVELAHHKELRQPNKAEFDRVLDKVIATSKDPIVIERANRYKNNQTWARPTAAE